MKENIEHVPDNLAKRQALNPSPCAALLFGFDSAAPATVATVAAVAAAAAATGSLRAATAISRGNHPRLRRRRRTMAWWAAPCGSTPRPRRSAGAGDHRRHSHHHSRHHVHHSHHGDHRSHHSSHHSSHQHRSHYEDGADRGAQRTSYNIGLIPRGGSHAPSVDGRGETQALLRPPVAVY
ncbi:unnamed protein product [Prorocentrum cordatum]|uniref:Uncharacterized protein n=1 Tax=Prorocentrum cordatum TaxID=2364126 RepID=A0ABN9RWU7_9DINO|nr:unnamed protein product [Polarella glacialis]